MHFEKQIILLNVLLHFNTYTKVNKVLSFINENPAFTKRTLASDNWKNPNWIIYMSRTVNWQMNHFFANF